MPSSLLALPWTRVCTLSDKCPFRIDGGDVGDSKLDTVNLGGDVSADPDLAVRIER